MKALSVFVAATIMAGTCSACPNLSGRYRLQGEDGQVFISIQQKGCSRITIVRENWYLGPPSGPGWDETLSVVVVIANVVLAVTLHSDATSLG